MSERDYPTDDELKRLREWDLHDPRGWLEFARSIWWMADWGWKELEHASTGGWSGNEEIIAVMQEAQMGLLWHQVWFSTRRGGHYTFEIPVQPSFQVGVTDSGEGPP